MNRGPGEPGKHNAKSLGGNSTMTTDTDKPEPADPQLEALAETYYSAFTSDIPNPFPWDAQDARFRCNVYAGVRAVLEALPNVEPLTAQAEIGSVEYVRDYRQEALAAAVQINIAAGVPTEAAFVAGEAAVLLAFLEGGDDK